MRNLLIVLLAMAMSGCTTRSLVHTALDVALTGGEDVRSAYRFFRGFNVGDNPLTGTYQVDFELPDGSEYTLFFRSLDRPNQATPNGGAHTSIFMAPSLDELPPLEDLASWFGDVDPDAWDDETSVMGGFMYQEALPSKSPEAIGYALTFFATDAFPGYEPLIHALWGGVEQKRALEHALPTFATVDPGADPPVIESVQYAHDRRTLLYRYRATRINEESYGR
jgi:hypothetical protein